jgi:hypothetical protein
MATTSTRQLQTEDERTQAGDTRNKPPAKDSRRVTEGAHDDIARRAYVHYEERGKEPGHDMDDWLQAEREVRQSHATE